MKKLIALSLVACFIAISAIGCGGDTKTGSSVKKDGGTTASTKKE